MDTTGQPEQTWTFMGHWDNDHIEVEYAVEGVVQDQRIDTGYWPQGLWAAAASGATIEEAQANAIAEYEDDEDLDVYDGQCRHCGAALRTDTRQDLAGSTRCDDADPFNAHHVPVGSEEPIPVYTTTDGREAVVVFAGGTNTGLKALRNSDGAIRIAYMNPDGTEPSHTDAEFDWYTGPLTQVRSL